MSTSFIIVVDQIGLKLALEMLVSFPSEKFCIDILYHLRWQLHKALEQNPDPLKLEPSYFRCETDKGFLLDCCHLGVALD